MGPTAQRGGQRRAPAPKRPGASPPRRRCRWLRRAVVWPLRLVLYGALFAAFALVGMVQSALPVLPRIEGSASFHRYVGLVYARDGHTVLRRLRADGTRHYIHEDDVPQILAQSVVAAEDHRFYEHAGIDPRGIARAAMADLRRHQLAEGGSTLTQQLVKNAYVGPQRTAGRKSREALLALALETRWSKQRILTAYLNTAYFGQGAYGVADASQVWFGRRVQHLDVAQAALLAGMLRAPEYDNPVASPERARARRLTVLDELLREGHITRAQHDAAVRAALPTAATVRRHTHRRGAELAPHFTDEVVGQLVSDYGAATALGSGLRVTTTLDARLQRAANAAAKRIEGTGLSTAIVAVDVRTGQVRALSIGGSAASDAFDIALLGHRQPGSAFKPFTLATALQHGLTPDTKLLSAPYDGTIDGVKWKVSNDESGYAHLETLARATWHSDNTVYARVAERVGIAPIVQTAHDLGIRSHLDAVPATVLGGLRDGVTPLEMAQSYATIARHGRRIDFTGGVPALVTDVRSPGAGRIVDGRNPPQLQTRQAVPAGIADVVTDVLEGVIHEGTGTRANIGRPAAGKTGTTEHNADAWFVGYTPNLALAVWVGHPEGAVPMTTDYHGAPVFGGTFPAEIWHDTMSAYLAGRQVRDFDLADAHFVAVRIDPTNRLKASAWCAGAVVEHFLAELAPTQESTTCDLRARRVPDVTGLTVAAALRKLAEAGFDASADERFNDLPPDALVAATTPAVGTAITQGTAIVVLPKGATATPDAAGTDDAGSADTNPDDDGVTSSPDELPTQ